MDAQPFTRAAELPQLKQLALAACPSLRFAVRVDFFAAVDELVLGKALAPGERWITVHPPGHDKGVPLLIREHPDGTASVIGGAGGSMNHLKLRGVKPQSSYREALTDKAAKRRAERKEQLAQEKTDGTHEAKQAARADVKAKVREVRRDFVQAVADAAGWDSKDVEFDDDAHAHLSDKAFARARADHEKKVFARARDMVNMNRKMLVEDHDARAASGLGEVPLASADADTLSAADLSPMPETKPGLGFSPAYRARAEAQGLTQQGLEQAVTGAAGEPSAQQQVAAEARKVTADAIKGELDAFAAQNPDTATLSPKVLEDAKKAADMVRAFKKMRLVEQAAREHSVQIDAGALHESKAAILEVSDADVEAAAAAEIEDAVNTAGTRAFLLEAEKLGGEDAVGGHLGTGAYNALNALAMTVAGDPLMDRSVVDVLGIDASAAVLARRIQASLDPDDLQNTRLAMADYHRDHYEKRQQQALDEAQALHDAAEAIALPDASDGFELAQAQAINARRRDAVADAKRVMGQAMGEMRANAALVMALGAHPVQSLDITLGKQSAESAVVQLHALGLKEGDFVLAPAGDDLVVTLHESGLDKLAAPADKEGLAIIKRNTDIAAGKHDEDDWLPQGFARRPDLAMQLSPGVATRLAEPFQPGPDLQASLRRYIGGRVADGDALQDVLADIQSADFFAKAGDNKAYRDALDAVAPLKGEGGKMRPVESLAPAFEKFADDFVLDAYGPDVSPLHRQAFEVDHDSVDALHRALAKTPEGVAAYKPLGELTPQERNGLRNWWYANIAKESPDAADLRTSLEALVQAEPEEKESVDMFGETSTNPQWSAWNAKRQELAGKVSASSLTWTRYVETMGSPGKAMQAVQDLVRGRVTDEFARTYNTLKPDAPLKLGRTTIRGALDHLDAVDPAARDARLAKHKELIDALRERIDGKYASGSVSDKLQAAKEAQQAMEQAQMGFFSVEDAPAPESLTASSLGADERLTVGHAADLKLAGMMSVVGQNFQPGKPSSIWQPSMNGKFVAQQRAVKHIVANKRTVLAYGAGSGKTGIMLGAFSHLHETGKAKRGLFLVPSIVQGQFGGEALRFLEPGKFKWNANPGQSREERIAAYKDPDTHFVVMTHQSFRDDLLHLGAQREGITEADLSAKLAGLSAQERAAWSKDLMAKEGIGFDFSAVDEAHDTVNRAGKENSSLANAIDSVTDNSEYHIYASGDPVKNDSSELQDVMAKMDRDRYGDRDAFMRKYGPDTLSSRQALKREMARHIISNVIDSGASKQRHTLKLAPSEEQQKALRELDKSAARCKLARMAGQIDVEAARRLSPGLFEGVPEQEHEKIAGAVQQSASIIRESAQKRILDAHPTSPKFDAVVQGIKQRAGKPGVVFAHRREAISVLEKRLSAEGLRVVTITGSDSAAEKDKKRLLFNPETGERHADVLLASDAAAVGMNLQSGHYLMQVDIPDTAKAHGQRNARIDRLGQKNDIELIDMQIDHPSETRARERLLKKYDLREFMLDPMDGLDDTGLAHFLRKRSLSAAQQKELI